MLGCQGPLAPENNFCAENQPQISSRFDLFFFPLGKIFLPRLSAWVRWIGRVSSRGDEFRGVSQCIVSRALFLCESLVRDYIVSLLRPGGGGGGAFVRRKTP